jgi:uncharacterized protein YjiS (DUF1127 family)
MSRNIVPANRLPLTERAADLFETVWVAVLEWRRRHRYRHELRELLLMDPKLIADLGMSLEEAKLEAEAPFWKSPYLPKLRLF